MCVSISLSDDNDGSNSVLHRGPWMAIALWPCPGLSVPNDQFASLTVHIFLAIVCSFRFQPFLWSPGTFWRDSLIYGAPSICTTSAFTPNIHGVWSFLGKLLFFLSSFFWRQWTSTWWAWRCRHPSEWLPYPRVGLEVYTGPFGRWFSYYGV